MTNHAGAGVIVMVLVSAAVAAFALLAPLRALVTVGEGLDEKTETPESITHADGWHRVGRVLLLHDPDYYSASGSWVRSAAALPRILEPPEVRRLKSRLLRRDGAATTVH